MDMGMLFTRPALLSQCMVIIRELGDAAQRRLAGGWAAGGAEKGYVSDGAGGKEKQGAWK